MRKATMIGIFLVILTAMAAVSISPMADVQAGNVLQDVPRLDGYQIYFSEVGAEASRFDRTDIGLSRFAGILELLGADLYTLEWRTGIPADADLLVIVGPSRDLTPDQTAWLWAYLQNGGRVLLVAEPFTANSRALAAAQGLLKLIWDDMGLRGRDDVVAIEGEFRMVVPPPAKTSGDQPTSTPAPPTEVPMLITDFLTASVSDSHPITQGLDEELAFFGARSLEIDGAPREAQVTPLVFTTSDFYGETDFNTYLDTQYVEYNIGADTPRTELVLAAAMEDIETGTRVVLVGDRDFTTNGGGFRTSPPYSSSFVYPGNVRFVLNSVAWLLEAEKVEGTIPFPTPGPTATATITPSPTPVPPPEGEPSS